MTDRDERALLSKLSEDLGSPEEAEEFLPVARRLRDWPAPNPTPQQTARLAAQLSAIRSAGHPRSRPTPPFGRLFSPFPWLLLRSQMRLVHSGLWIASPLVIALGTWLAWVSSPSGNGLPLALVAPVVAAIGIAFIYGTDADPALEIELSTPVPARAILLARLALVFAFNLGLGLLASAVLAAAHSGLSFWPLVSTWLAPMAFLSALSFFVTVLWSDSGAGVSLSLGWWVVLNLLRLVDLRAFPLLSRLPEFFTPQAVPCLWAAAIGMGVAALWLAGIEERWLSNPG